MVEIATAQGQEEIKRLVAGLSTRVDQLAKQIRESEEEAIPHWVTVKYAAQYLQLKPNTVRKKVRDGYFDIKRGRKNILISRESLLTYPNR